MNRYLAGAGALAIAVGLLHSLLGEILIFNRMRQGGRLVPTNGGKLIGEGHVRILWASWHVLTVLGWLAAAILWSLAMLPVQAPSQAFIVQAIAAAMLVGALLVLVGTKARHPGWIGLLAVGVLAWLGRGP